MKILWLGGWAISPAFVLARVKERFPDVEHQVLPPTRNARAEQGFDWVVGHSLGSFLALRWPEGFPAKRGVALLAPFLSFCCENKLGGKVSRTQLQVTARCLRRDALAAVNDFYERAELGLRAESLPYSIEDLAWGLDVLLTETVDTKAPERHHLRVVLGDSDPLLDTNRLTESFPHATILPEVGHRFEDLLAGFHFHESSHA